MGCINSKRDLNDINPNVYRVVNVNEDGIALWSGQLEITPKELILYRKGKEPTRWSLQHLRRYGFDADIFTFEVGRRCTTGEGIYAFKCRRAESLFHVLQSYIHGIALADDSNHQVSDFISSNTSSNGPIHQVRSSSTRPVVSWQTGIGSQAQFGNYVNPTSRPNSAGSNGVVSMVNSNRSVDVLSTESNYLEPTSPVRASIGTRHPTGIRLSSVGSGPLSPEPNSPGSPNSFTIFLEVTQLNQHQNAYQNSNIYQDFPIRSSENNNNLLNKKLSLDIPPQEPAPAITTVQHIGMSVDGFGSPKVSPTESDPSHMYVNVTPGEFEGAIKSGTPPVNSVNQVNNFIFPKLASTYSIDPSIRCYENLELSDLRSMGSRARNSKPDIFAKVDLATNGLIGESDKSGPTTPVSKKEHRKVNYIELDLDQSPSSNSIVTSGSSANSLITITTSSSSNSTNTIVQSSVNNNNNNIVKVTTPTLITGPNLLAPESPKKAAGGYAEIDFNKTVALSNTTASLELDSEGSRKTRHSSTARQSNSVSD